ncbi:MAG: hypothetical protein M0R80_07585 [Proteobacteria bacterium]|jgi:hypothetical protein|nr:hypothetical protein [Pseudomonadota bacterium]
MDDDFLLTPTEPEDELDEEPKSKPLPILQYLLFAVIFTIDIIIFCWIYAETTIK